MEFIINTDRYLHKIFANYLDKYIEHYQFYDNTDKTLSQQVKIKIISNLSLKYLLIIKKIFNVSKIGLLASFKNRINYANKTLNNVNKIIIHSELNKEASLIIENHVYPIKSYINYRQHDYKIAKENLYMALEACIDLVNKYHYYFLKGRPIHLICNLLKIEACSGNKEKAINIACYLTSIMNGNHNDLLFKDIDLLKPVQYLSFKDEDFLLTQVFEEMAKLLASCDKQEFNKLVNIATDTFAQCNLSSDIQSKREYAWFKNKQLLAQGKIEQFLEESSNFIAEGRGYCKLLWHDTVLDVLKICQTIDSEISRKLQEQIREDFAKYPYLPSVLKA